MLRDRRETPLTRFAGMLYELLDEKAISADGFDLSTYAEVYTGLMDYPGGWEIASSFEALAVFLSYDDLFAGTGSVGIEALSRGARQAVFVERDRRAIETIEENLRITGLAAQAELVRDGVFKFLAREPAERFDLIYIAPPQYKGLWAETLLALDGRDFGSESR